MPDTQLSHCTGPFSDEGRRAELKLFTPSEFSLGSGKRAEASERLHCFALHYWAMFRFVHPPSCNVTSEINRD